MKLGISGAFLILTVIYSHNWRMSTTGKENLVRFYISALKAVERESPFQATHIAFRSGGSADPGSGFSNLPGVNIAVKSLAQRRDCGKLYRIKEVKDRGPKRVASFPCG